MQEQKRLSPPTPKRKRGRPVEDSRFDPTPEHRNIVELCAGFGIPEDEMIRLIINPDTKKPISKNTLLKYFRVEIDRGRTTAKFKVIGGLYKNATTPTDTNPGGIPVAQIFWLKTQAGWKEAQPDAPTPPREEVDEVNRLEIARRVAFTLISGARNAPQAAIPAPVKQASKSKAKTAA